MRDIKLHIVDLTFMRDIILHIVDLTFMRDIKTASLRFV